MTFSNLLFEILCIAFVNYRRHNSPNYSKYGCSCNSYCERPTQEESLPNLAGISWPTELAKLKCYQECSFAKR